jgi:hypothetical protein
MPSRVCLIDNNKAIQRFCEGVHPQTRMCSTRSPKCLNFKANQQVSPLGPITS